MSFKTTVLGILISLILACSAAEDTRVTEASNSIVGVWQGVQQMISGDSEQVREVSLAFFANGQFELKEREGERSGEGTYEDFSRLNSLTMRFKTSNLTDFALAGSIYNFEYEIYGQEMLLRAQRVIFRLKRPEQVTQGDELNGQWRCVDSLEGQSWQLTTLGTEFYLYSRRNRQASIFLKGEMNWDEEDLEVDLAVKGQWLVRDAQPLRIFDGFDVTIIKNEQQKATLTLVPWNLVAPGQDPQNSNLILTCQT